MYYEENPLAVITCGDCGEHIGIYPDVYNNNRIVCPSCGTVWSLKGSLKAQCEEPFLKFKGDLRLRHYTDSIYYIDNYNRTIPVWEKSHIDIVRFCIWLGLALTCTVLFLTLNMIGVAIGAAVVTLIILLIALPGLITRCPNCGKMYAFKVIHSHIINRHNSGTEYNKRDTDAQAGAIERKEALPSGNNRRYIVHECSLCKYRVLGHARAQQA